MIDLDSPLIAGLFCVTVALAVPLVYSLFVDKHKKGTEDPRKNIF